MALTVRELIRLLSNLPEECQDLEVVTSDEGPERCHNQREWGYQIGKPYRYHNDPQITIPVCGVAHPLTREGLAQMPPQIRKYCQDRIISGQWPPLEE
jgi:hypothetical protein